MGIPPDAYPEGQPGILYSGTTLFDGGSKEKHVRSAEIRGGAGVDVHSLSITVIPPKGKPPMPLASVKFGSTNGDEPQIAVEIQSPDGSAIADGYKCQFAFLSSKRAAGK